MDCGKFSAVKVFPAPLLLPYALSSMNNRFYLLHCCFYLLLLKFIYNAGIVLSILPDLKILLVFSSNLWYKYLARFGVF